MLDHFESVGPRRGSALAVQRSFDDLGTALVDTEFCVFDLETTGGSPESSRITEIGAVKVRGGEVLGEFATLINPGVPIPPAITYLTGITNAMVYPAPTIDAVLPSFLEFIGNAVFVAHNASFDTRFLAANLARYGYQPARNPIVCTVRLARRLVREEVPNLQLATLARALRARTAPCHRALDDARATVDVFHALLERAGRWGISDLDDLLWFQSARGHPSYDKVRLAEDLPRARGVYLFRGARERVLYVGKAADLRSRVRSYFGGDDRRRIDGLLREVESIEHILCGQIGRCPAPCDGAIEPATYAPIVGPVAGALAGDPSEIIGILSERIEHLSAVARFEEAATTRDRLGALVEAVRGLRAVRAIHAARIEIAIGDVRTAIHRGFLVLEPDKPAADGHPDEPRLVAAWLWRNRARIQIQACDGEVASAIAGGSALAAWAERLRRLRLVEDGRAAGR